MPFTFSHPAIVLPLTFSKRRWLSATGLIIGSMTPDFEYFIRMKVQSEYSHTLLGLLWFDLPLGLMLCFLYHSNVRNSLISNLRQFLRKRLSGYKTFNWMDYFKNKWLTVIISLLIGAFSHLLWDSFTHDTGYFVKRLSILQGDISFGNCTFPIYKLLQHLSTVFGGLFIAFTLLTLKKHSTTSHKKAERYWLTVIVITLTVLVLRVFLGLNFTQYGNLIVTSIAGGLVALILTPLILKRE
jgi:hypothetical protein